MARANNFDLTDLDEDVIVIGENGPRGAMVGSSFQRIQQPCFEPLQTFLVNQENVAVLVTCSGNDTVFARCIRMGRVNAREGRVEYDPGRSLGVAPQSFGGSRTRVGILGVLQAAGSAACS